MHTIRQAILTDLPVLRHFWTLEVMSEPYPEDQAEDADVATRQLAAMLAAPEPPGFAFLAEDDVESAPALIAAVGGSITRRQPVGFLLYQICYRAVGQPRRYAFCSHLYVTPEARGRGIAGDLCEIAAAHALSQGLTSIELNAVPGHRFNEALGHTTVALRMQTTPARLIAALDRLRERHQRTNGLDTDTVQVPLTAATHVLKE